MTKEQRTNIRRLADIAATEGRIAAENDRREEWEFHRGSLTALQQLAELEDEAGLSEELWRMLLKLDRDWFLIMEESA